MNLSEQQKESMRSEIQEKMGVYLFGAELDKMLSIVQKHSPKSFSSTVIEQGRAGTNATDRGIQRADDNANEEWKKMAAQCVRKVCEKHETFTSDEVYEEIGKHPQKTGNMSALGAIMLRAKKDGWCVPTADYRCSARPIAHRKPMIVWKSLLV